MYIPEIISGSGRWPTAPAGALNKRWIGDFLTCLTQQIYYNISFLFCQPQVTRGKEDVHLAESYLAHLSTMLPIVMQLQTTVTTLQGEAIALQRKATTHERNEAELKAKVTALESTMVTIAKYEY